MREKIKIKPSNWISVSEEIRLREEENLRKLSERPKISQKERAEKDKMIAKAAEFVKNGIPFEMAPEELQKHYFFKIGYDIAIRRQKISEGTNKSRG